MAHSPNWRPSATVDVARRRADMLARVRDYFLQQKVLAVDTPAISAFASSDPNIDNIALLRESTEKWLHTSPESAMKCLLAAGYPDIYSICRVFRDGEQGPRHLPEFTLLEWYRLGFQLPEIIADTTTLIARCMQQEALAESLEVIDYADAFRRSAGVDVFAASSDELAAAANADDAIRQSLGDDRAAWLDLLLVDRVSPTFAPDRLTVLQHYPRPQAALARACPADEQVADRFEVFYGTLELANGYVELTDAVEQRQRFLKDTKDRQAAGKIATPVDELLLAALQHGMPQCAGVAVGFERLQMIYEKVDHISDVVTFANRSGQQNA
ncbi:MAG: EF-P lysine aminoacylase EpmA [Woeseiaceae bacterium]